MLLRPPPPTSPPLLLLPLLLLLRECAAALSCIGSSGGLVDWFFVLKHPRGWAGSLVSSDGEDGRWRPIDLADDNNAVAATLAVLRQGDGSGRQAAASSSIAFAAWNDEDPATGREQWHKAHSKGAAAWQVDEGGSAAGWWMVHSVPRWPLNPSSGPRFAGLARPQALFGQSFLCVSLSGAGAIEAVARGLAVAGPHVFASSLPPAWAAQFPAWAALLRGNSSGGNSSGSSSARDGDVQQQLLSDIALATAAGVPLRAFAKSAALAASLTDDVVGPRLLLLRQQPVGGGSSSGGMIMNRAMLWQTWRRGGGGPLASRCQRGGAGVDALNVAAVALPPPDGGNSSSDLGGGTWTAAAAAAAAWQWRSDHSKWGVAAASNGSGGSGDDDSGLFVCVGDLNRAAAQAHRGGGYCCLRDARLWRAVRTAVVAVEPCVRES
jgi:hypothetical protein